MSSYFNIYFISSSYNPSSLPYNIFDTYFQEIDPFLSPSNKTNAYFSFNFSFSFYLLIPYATNSLYYKVPLLFTSNLENVSLAIFNANYFPYILEYPYINYYLDNTPSPLLSKN